MEKICLSEIINMFKLYISKERMLIRQTVLFFFFIFYFVKRTSARDISKKLVGKKGREDKFHASHPFKGTFFSPETDKRRPVPKSFKIT